MADRYHNPFQTFDILVPVEFHESLFERYCQTGGGKRIEASPFPRMIDLWFFALCIAVKEQKDPINYSSLQTTKIIDGSILSQDPWRIHALMLIATSLTDSIDIVSDPRKVMTLASELAVAGLPIVQDMLNSGQQAPLWNLSDSIAKMTG